MKWRLTVAAMSLLFFAIPLAVHAQDIELSTYTPEQRWERAASQVGAAMVGAIAYAKSRGESAEAWGQAVADIFAPGWGEAGSGTLGIVQGMHRNYSLWPDCEFEIVTQSETSITVRANHPWEGFFGEDQVSYGVTLEEFGEAFQVFNSRLSEHLGLGYESWEEDGWQYMTFSLKS